VILAKKELRVLVSIILPACDAEATLPRAVGSLLAQGWKEWEALIVADDARDYAALLRARGIDDARLRFLATGGVRTGCHRARNVGLAQARGALVGMLDADDLFHPDRLARLAPLAAARGAVADNLAVVAEESGALLYRVMGEITAMARLDIAGLLALTAPLAPLVKRDYALPRLAGIEYAEDVIANLRLIDRLGALSVVAESFYEYRVIAGSIAHAEQAAAAFDAAYGSYVARLERGDGLGLAPANRAVAARGLAAKRALNQAFARAQAENPALNFQTFVAPRQSKAGGVCVGALAGSGIGQHVGRAAEAGTPGEVPDAAPGGRISGGTGAAAGCPPAASPRR
jgi:succinoglycan biosynthesis protein ExoO